MQVRKLSQEARDLIERSFGKDLTLFEFGERGEGWLSDLKDWLKNGDRAIEFKGENFVPFGILRQIKELVRIGEEKLLSLEDC